MIVLDRRRVARCQGNFCVADQAKARRLATYVTCDFSRFVKQVDVATLSKVHCMTTVRVVV